MRKRLYLIPAILAIFALVFFITSKNILPTAKEKAPNDLNKSFPHSYKANWNTASDEERLKTLTERKDKLDSYKDLNSKVKYKVKTPKDTLGKNILGVFVSKETNGLDKIVEMYYEGGLHIVETPNDVPVDYDNIIKEDFEAKSKNAKRGDTDFRLATINGFKGLSAEPGFAKWEHYKEPTPGVVAWYENGVEYTIYGYDIPVKDLIKIAESMN